MNFRLTMLLAGAVILLFIFFIWWGSRSDKDRAFQLDLEVPTARQLRNRFTTKYTADEIRLARGGESGCAISGQRLVIPPDVTCEFQLRAAANQTKQLILTLDSVSKSIDITLSQENALTITQMLTSGQTSESLDVYRHEAELNALLQVANCVLPEPEDEDEKPPTPPPCFLALTAG